MTILSVLGLLLVAVTMGLALAHALEFPGKVRLDEQAYRAVQTIYYPGFTLGGLVGEAGALVVLVALVLITPTGTERFWWTAAALAFLVLLHATYWVVTHPVNGVWLRQTELSATGAFFFGLFSPRAGGNWMQLRDLWEYSHIARACFGMASLFSMTMALIRQ
jgi:hypothetical protein